MAETIISKISVKTLGADPKRAVKEEKPVALVRIWGIAEAVKYVVNRATGDTNTALVGTFRGQNLETGELFDSGVCYLPAGLHDQVTGPLIRAKETGAGDGPVKFAIEISSRPDKNPVGYSYTGRPLMKPEGVDPLADMSKPLQIAAPKKTPAKATA